MSEKDAMQGMSEQRLAEIIDAYGAAAERWPDAERSLAKDLLAHSTQARVMLDEAAELDAMLNHLPNEEIPSAALVDRIMAARPRAIPVSVKNTAPRAKSWRSLWPYGSAALPTGALAFSMMLGIALGATMQTQNTDTTTSVSQADSDQLVTLALAETSYPEEWKP